MVPYPNWITINLDHLVHNIQYLQSLTPKGCKFLFPVKADAYGHGSLACSFAAAKAEINGLGVAHLFEGVALREYGSTQEILVLGPLTPSDFDTCLKYQLTPSITRLDTARAFENFLQARGVIQRAHIKVDTGMGRYGFHHEDIESINEILAYKHISIDGIFSHFACAEDLNHPLNQQQIERFDKMKAELQGDVELYHMANSAGTLNYPQSHMDMIRPGLSVYGYTPNLSNPRSLNLKPVMQLEATIREIKEIQVGEGVSYGQKWIADKPTLVASVAIGYGDGFRRSVLEDTSVVIQGVKCPVIGSVCMDTIMIDISQLTHPPVVGGSVKVIEGIDFPELSVESMARQMNISSYELTCGVARRLQRRYIWRGQILLWDELKSQLGIQERIQH